MKDGKIIIEVKDGVVNTGIDKSFLPAEALQLLLGMALALLKNQMSEPPKVKEPTQQEIEKLEGH